MSQKTVEMLKPKQNGSTFPDDYHAEIEEAVSEFARAYRKLQTTAVEKRKAACRSDTGRDNIFMGLHALPAMESAKTPLAWCYEFSRYRDAGGTFEEILFELGGSFPHRLMPMMTHDGPLPLARLGTHYGFTRGEQLVRKASIVKATRALPFLNSCGLIQWVGSQEITRDSELAIAPPKSLREFRRLLYCFYGHLGILPADEYMDWLTLSLFGAATGAKPSRPRTGVGFRVNGDHGHTPGLHETPTPILILSDSALPQDKLKAFLESELSFLCPYPVSELTNQA